MERTCRKSAGKHFLRCWKSPCWKPYYWRTVSCTTCTRLYVSQCKLTGAKKGRDFGFNPDCRAGAYYCKTRSDCITSILVYTWYMVKRAPIYRAGKAVDLLCAVYCSTALHDARRLQPRSSIDDISWTWTCDIRRTTCPKNLSTKQNKNDNQTSYVTGVWCFGSAWLMMSGAVIVDGDDGYGSWCVAWGDVFALLLPFLKWGTYLGVCRPFL